MDGQPVYLFFLLVAPENAANMHLKTLARIARILKNSAFRNVLMKVPTKREIYNAIIQDDDDI
jgi:PTS system nitrogen regulatory IIA component